MQKALAEENAARGITQASIAATLGVNRSVVHRQIMGLENITLGRVAEIADVLGRDITFALPRPEQHAGNAPARKVRLQGQEPAPAGWHHFAESIEKWTRHFMGSA